MVHGDGDVPRWQGFAAGDGVGKRRGKQILRAHPLEPKGYPAPATRPLHEQRARRVPAPARFEHRLRQDRLHQDLARGHRVQVLEHLFERERMLRAQRQHESFLVGRGLQLEAEPHAEALPQGEAERPVDPAAERRVHDELHTTTLVEEALDDDAAVCRNGAQRARAVRDVRPQVLVIAASLPDFRDERGKLRCPRGRFAEPERDCRRSTLRVGHAHGAGFDPENSPRMRAQLNDIAAFAIRWRNPR